VPSQRRRRVHLTTGQGSHARVLDQRIEVEAVQVPHRSVVLDDVDELMDNWESAQSASSLRPIAPLQ